MRRSRISFLIGALACLALAGCQGGAPMPTPSSTPSASGASDGSGVDPGDQVTPSGATVIGDLGDPCALLTKSEIQKALGVAVLGLVRGEVQPDGSQVCAWSMDAGGSTAAALGPVMGTVPPLGKLGPVVDAMAASGGVFGVVLQRSDPPDASDDGDDDGSTPDHPGVSIKKVQVGAGGAVVATPNGGAAFANDGIHTNLTLMDLIAGPSDGDALESLLTKAYNRLGTS
jgi:hypothetical protein